MELIHIRLREEIERVYGVARGALAQAARDMGLEGVQELSDVALARKRVTANLLAQLAPLGVDVQYVVTGQRAGESALKAEAPKGVSVLGGQAHLSLQQWGALLNLRREVGQGKDLLWGPTLLSAISEYTPADPVPVVAQRVTLQAKHGRTREALAVYLVANQPSAPWFVWPDGGKLAQVYSLDTGTDTLPLLVPELPGFPSPALALEQAEMCAIDQAGHVMCEPAAGGGLRARDVGGAYVGHVGRIFAKAFVAR